MYTKKLPFHDFNETPRNATLHFNLTEPEVIKLMVEFKAIFEWRDRIDVVDMIELDPAEVVEFYNHFEEVVLSAYGVPSSDGLYFDKSDKYKFAESAMFAAYLVETLSDLSELERFISGILPKNMEKLIKAADDNVAALAAKEGNGPEAEAEIARLKAELEAARGIS